MSTSDLKKRTEEIRKIYQDFLVKLLPYRKEQDEILQELAEELNRKKVEQIRKRIQTSS